MANLVFDFLHNYHAGERRDSEPANTYQYDEGHVIEANLPQVITSCEIHYWIRGMEEAEAYVPTSITPNSDGTCTVIGHVPNEYFRTNGELRVYIVVTDGDASITTYEGRIQVYPRSMPDDYVDDDPENEAVQIIAAARGYAETSEAWAVGQVNGEDVPSTADQYQNNAAYYADQAAAAASSAAAQASLAPAYDNTATYEVGDIVLHDGQLYECTTAITTAEAWTAAHWTAVTVGEKVADLEADTNQLKEETTSISNEVDTVLAQSKYLNRTATTVSLTWTEGGYYNFVGDGSVVPLSGRAYSQKIDCVSGDIIIAFNNKGQICFWNADGTFNSYKATDYPTYYALYIVPSGVTKYAFNNNDSSIRMASCTHYVDNDSIVTETYEAPAKLIYDSKYFTNGRYASTNNGKLSNMNSTWNCGIMLPCEANHKYRTETQTQIVFYDSSMTFISAIIPNNTASYTGKTVEMDFTTPSNATYMSINSTDNAHEKVFDIDDYTVTGNVINPLKLHGKTVVCFGDSITGNYGFGDNYPYQIEKITGAKTYNCGFGGCRMELIDSDPQHTNPFSMCGIVDALEAVENDDATAWDDQDEYAESISKMVYLRLQILKAIDWSKVDIVTIAYGTNEGGYPQDDENDKYNKYTYAGATRYAVNKLLTLYPKLRVVLLTPIYRYYTADQQDSDTRPHPTYGGTLADNVATLISVGHELKIPVIDMYYTFGINITNYTSYFGDDDETSDGTHINSFGREQYGKRVAGELIRLL